MKYAFIVETDDCWELWIGKDIPGLASHGAATLAGMFSSHSAAFEAAISRGVDRDHIK